MTKHPGIVHNSMSCIAERPYHVFHCISLWSDLFRPRLLIRKPRCASKNRRGIYVYMPQLGTYLHDETSSLQTACGYFIYFNTVCFRPGDCEHCAVH